MRICSFLSLSCCHGAHATLHNGQLWTDSRSCLHSLLPSSQGPNMGSHSPCSAIVFPLLPFWDKPGSRGSGGSGRRGGLNHRSAQSEWPKVLDNPCFDDPASEALANHRSRCSCGVLLHLACLVCFFQDSTHQQQEHRHDMSSPLSHPRLMLIPSPHVRATAKTSSHFDTTQSTL